MKAKKKAADLTCYAGHTWKPPQWFNHKEAPVPVLVSICKKCNEARRV